MRFNKMFSLVLDEEGFTTEGLFNKVDLRHAKATSMSKDTHESPVRPSNST